MSEIGLIINVCNPMQPNFQHQLSAPEGKNYTDDFEPHFIPKEMLAMGVFEGKYLNICQQEYPND